MTGDPLDRLEQRAYRQAAHGAETFGKGWIPTMIVAVPDVLALVEVARAAREIGRPGRSVEMEFPYLAERIEALRAALARLDGPR